MINLSRDEKKATREENCLVWTSTGNRSRTEKSTSCAGDWLWEKYAEHAFFLVILRISGATGRDANANCSIKISLVYYVQLIGNLCYNVAICEIIYRGYFELGKFIYMKRIDLWEFVSIFRQRIDRLYSDLPKENEFFIEKVLRVNYIVSY